MSMALIRSFKVSKYRRMQHLMNLAVFLFLYKYFEAILILRRIEYLVNWSKIIVGVTLIWRYFNLAKSCNCYTFNSFKKYIGVI